MGKATFAPGWRWSERVSLYAPESASLDASGNLWIADSGNSRVLEYDSPLCPGDYDCDGYTDATEVAMGKDPFTFCATMRADLNMDGTVNGLDLNMLTKRFLKTVPPAPARVDLNADNVINGLDLNVLGKRFLHSVQECP